MESAVMEIQYRRNDGSFVAIVNGNPYHITPHDPLFLEAKELGQDAPFEPEFVSPPPTPEERIAELKALLTNSDYKVLPDYDKPDEAIVAQRQAWRDEIRELEA